MVERLGGLERKPSAVAAPAVQAQHFSAPKLGELCMLVHAPAAYLLQGRAHDFSEISLQCLVSMMIARKMCAGQPS